jgi:hypothetical protein
MNDEIKRSVSMILGIAGSIRSIIVAEKCNFHL